MNRMAPITALNLNAPCNVRLLRGNKTNGSAVVQNAPNNGISGGPGSGSRGCN